MACRRSARDRENPAAWDEHRWEQLMQEQEQRAEKFLELLEKYASHPNREELVARETGWPEASAPDSCDTPSPGSAAPPDWDASEEDLDVAEGDGHRAGPGAPGGTFRSEREREDWAFARQNPAYRKAHKFCGEIHQFLPEGPGRESPPQPIVDLMSHAYGVSARLAGGLAGSHGGEDLGMTIAYLKRGLAALHHCLRTLRVIEEGAFLREEQVACLRDRALEVREEIVTQVAGYRRKWRDRHGTR